MSALCQQALRQGLRPGPAPRGRRASLGLALFLLASAPAWGQLPPLDEPDAVSGGPQPAPEEAWGPEESGEEAPPDAAADAPAAPSLGAPGAFRAGGAAARVDAGPALSLPAGMEAGTPRPTRDLPWVLAPGGDLSSVSGERLSLVSIGECEGVVCGDRRTLEQIESLSDLHAGSRLEQAALERSRSNLMATGYFRQVRYELRPGPVGVDLRIHLVGEVFVERVRIEVEEWFPAVFESEIRQRLVYAPGKALERDPEVRRRQEETIRRLYERKGFEGTQVKIRWRVQGHRAEVSIRITEGKGYGLRDVHVRGASFFTADEVAQVFAGSLNLSGTTLWGATLIPALTQEIREERETELMRLYQEEGYFEVSLRSRVEKDPAAALLDLWVDVDEGPRYRVDFTDNSALKDWDLREKLSFWQSRSVGEADIRSSAEAMRQAYQVEGYYFAEVRPRVDPADPTHLTFAVHEGAKAEIASIHFKGNGAFSADDRVLKEVLASGESSLFKTRRMIPEQVEADRRRLEEFYRDHGYLLVRVGAPRVYLDAARTQLWLREEEPVPAELAPAVAAGRVVLVRTAPRAGPVSLFLDIPLAEGPQSRVRSLVLQGYRALSAEQVAGYLRLRAGDPFSPQRISAGVAKLRTYYTEAGFPNARVSLSCRSEGFGDTCAAQGVQGPLVDIALRVDEGRQARLGELFVRGNSRTRTQVILDEIPMRPGDLFDRNKLMEGQARLRSLGLFRALRIVEIGSQPEEPRSRVALVIEVEERDNRFVEFNVTLRSVGLEQGTTTLLWGFQTRYVERNLLGRGLHLSVPFMIGNEKTGLEPGLLWPRPFKLMLPTTFRLFSTMENDLRSSVDVVPVATDLGSFFGASSLFDNYNRFRFGSELKVLLERWGLRITPSVRVEREGERKTSAQKLCLRGQGSRAECIDFDNLVRLGVPVLYDRRDNPLHPTTGYSLLVEGNYSRKLLLGESAELQNQYARLMSTAQGYVPFFDSRLVVATMLRFSWVIPLEGLESDIPSEDRFFLGGDGKLRGFAEMSVGPRDAAGLPEGDLVRLLGTAELRIHLAWWMWTAVFYDTGLLVHGPMDMDLGLLRHSVGLGLRMLLLDLIPLRFDFARALDRRLGDEVSVFSFNLGYTF